MNQCNLDCFFCHNEAMPNPRRGGAAGDRLGNDGLLGLINAWCRLGGRQVNITGGEPLAHDDLPGLLDQVDKGDTRFALNTNAVLAHRLIRRPVLPTIDVILASLHTTDNDVFRQNLGGNNIIRVMDNIVALRLHGYDVEINYSLGPYNAAAFPKVLDFALESEVALKAIAFVRPDESKDFYGGVWVDPEWIGGLLSSRGGEIVNEKLAFGGYTTTWMVDGTSVKVKNIARGRLATDFCDGCDHINACGEGVYGIRVGVDGVFKPCLLRKDRFVPATDAPWEDQVLGIVDTMVGDWERSRYREGAPV